MAIAGVVLVTMLEHLTGKTVRGINRNPKHNMTIMANLQVRAVIWSLARLLMCDHPFRESTNPLD